MHKVLENSLEDALNCIAQLKTKESFHFMSASANMIATSFSQGKKVLVAGNGGSLSDATHFAEELTGFFRSPRRALPAIALADAAHITCVGNDAGFHEVFSRGVEALGQEGDIFIGLSTSGNSQNIVSAFDTAKRKGLKTIAFLGKGGGRLKGIADLELIIDFHASSDRIQEAHMTAMHLIIDLVERNLFHSP